MEELFSFLNESLKSTPTLFPYILVVSAVVVLFVTQKDRISQLFDSRIDANESRKKMDIIVTELIRNNTAALNNNTAALEGISNERKELKASIKQHNELVTERMDNLQNTLNSLESMVIDGCKSITVIEDRTDKR